MSVKRLLKHAEKMEAKYYSSAPDVPQNQISRKTLRRSKSEDLIRLAKFLHLHIDGMSHSQIAALVRWRITRIIESSIG